MEKENHILIVGVESSLAKSLSDVLESDTMAVSVVEDSIAAFKLITQCTIDFLLIDYDESRMNWKDYLEIVHYVDQRIVNGVVYNGDERIALEILESLADLHIPKQQSVELSAELIRSNVNTLNTKVGKVERRTNHFEQQGNAGTLAIFFDTMRVEQNGEKVDITATEFQILTYLIHEKERIVSRDELLELMYGEACNDKDYRNVDVHIKNLRSKIGYNAIQSIRGFGYRWVEA